MHFFAVFVISLICSYKSVQAVRACEGSTLHIKCDWAKGETIQISRANYGRTERNICHYEDVTNCRASNSFDIVSRRCNSKVECYVSASNSVFGDPCGGTYKYLNVDYRCVQTQKTATACEGKTLPIRCDPGKYILISEANYGRTNTYTCGGRTDTNYIHCNNWSMAFLIMGIYCNYRNECDVNATNDVFGGDPCGGTYKYLHVKYHCH